VTKLTFIIQIAQVISALSYLHNLEPHIVHGDIKAANILINPKGEASLTDFGFSCVLEQSGFTTKTGSSGSMRWMAPELLIASDDEENERAIPSPPAVVPKSWRWKAYELIAPCKDEAFVPRVTLASDVWAFGMTVMEVRHSFFMSPHRGR
jgi:serine/threonine protein kinase